MQLAYTQHFRGASRPMLC